MWVMAWQRVSCLVTYLSTPSTPSLLHDKLHPQLDQDRWRWRLNCLRSCAAFAKRELLKRDKQRLNESCLNWAFCCNVFSLKSVTLWCQSKWAWRPERPRGGSREVWSVRATLKHRGAVPFPESRKPTFEEAPWVRFLLISSSDTVPGWSAGMQPGKHLGGILWTFPDSEK